MIIDRWKIARESQELIKEACKDCEDEGSLYFIESPVTDLTDRQELKRMHEDRTGHNTWRQIE